MGKSNDITCPGKHRNAVKHKKAKRYDHHCVRTYNRAINTDDIMLFKPSYDHCRGYPRITGIAPNIPNNPTFYAKEFIKFKGRYFWFQDANKLNKKPEYAHMPIINILKDKLENPLFNYKAKKYISCSIKQLQRRGKMEVFTGHRSHVYEHEHEYEYEY